ncbi:glycosyltransferase family 2 protein [Cohnella candidum]|uniref:Glycosyltransferase n=1 Tax=Cohnella candidum TaxID=2674991 RepID=A0A3G3JXC6_9BACL|nr:glycosyltransferase [Cohnella candidum]AYQ72159.1 glycosyltransferase [Cohnella candidum]
MAHFISRKYGVSIVTCTNRPEFFTNLLKNYKNQRYRNKELIIVLNNDSMHLDDYRDKVAQYPNVSVYQLPESVSLGRCLNHGIAHAKLPLIAKFDDDDYYSPYYLLEQVKALVRKRSDVVGKHACLVYVAAKKKLIIRSPSQKNKFLTFVQGGTILFRMRVFKKVRFANRTVGEDVKFLRSCRKKGFKVYATSPFNYVYIRRKNKKSHTWKANDRFYLAGSRHVAKTQQFRRIAIRKM